MSNDDRQRSRWLAKVKFLNSTFLVASQQQILSGVLIVVAYDDLFIVVFCVIYSTSFVVPEGCYHKLTIKFLYFKFFNLIFFGVTMPSILNSFLSQKVYPNFATFNRFFPEILKVGLLKIPNI